MILKNFANLMKNKNAVPITKAVNITGLVFGCYYLLIALIRVPLMLSSLFYIFAFGFGFGILHLIYRILRFAAPLLFSFTLICFGLKRERKRNSGQLMNFVLWGAVEQMVIPILGGLIYAAAWFVRHGYFYIGSAKLIMNIFFVTCLLLILYVLLYLDGDYVPFRLSKRSFADAKNEAGNIASGLSSAFKNVSNGTNSMEQESRFSEKVEEETPDKENRASADDEMSSENRADGGESAETGQETQN